MPGTSGVLSPYSDMDGFYFDNSPEPDDFRFEFMKDVEEVVRKKGSKPITIKAKSKKEFYDVLRESREFTEDNVVVAHIPRKGRYDVVVEEEEDLEEPKEPKPVPKKVAKK